MSAVRSTLHTRDVSWLCCQCLMRSLSRNLFIYQSLTKHAVQSTGNALDSWCCTTLCACGVIHEKHNPALSSRDFDLSEHNMTGAEMGIPPAQTPVCVPGMVLQRKLQTPQLFWSVFRVHAYAVAAGLAVCTDVPTPPRSCAHACMLLTACTDREHLWHERAPACFDSTRQPAEVTAGHVCVCLSYFLQQVKLCFLLCTRQLIKQLKAGCGRTRWSRHLSNMEGPTGHARLYTQQTGVSSST